MATIDITKPVFGNKSATASNNSAKPKAQVWLNIGFEVDVPNDEGVMEKRFINLPMGMPLDTMEEVVTTSSNQVYAAMQIAKNDLLKQLIAAAGQLPPGGERVLGGLQIQMRRVNAADGNAALADPNHNPFLKVLAL